MTKEQSSGAPKVLDTTREAVERLARAYDINAGEVMHSDTSHTADTLRALLTRAEAAEAAVRKLVTLNDDYSPFGGEILQDRVDRTWEEARAFLATLDQPKGGKDDE